MRQRFNRRQRNYIILGLCSILLVMAAGYAAFKSQLTINGTSNITSDWKVLITDIQSKTLSGDAADAEVPSHTETTATFKTNLVSPGDSMQYTVTVENRGNIDAVLKTLSKTDSSNDAIIFEITGIEQGDTLKSHNSTTFNVTVTYNPEITNQPDNITSDLTITLDYVQAGTTDTGEVLPIKNNVMRSYHWNTTNDYHSDEYREKITSIEFSNNKNIPSEAVQSWDVSERQDGSVMAWIVNDTENAGYYKLYIGGDGGVVANPNSSTLFANFKQTKTIDLSNLDTSYVTDMNYMFDGMSHLENITFGEKFDTSNVTDMHGMFNWCVSLKSLDLSNFNTSRVTNMMGMFPYCRSLTELDLSNFDTSNVTNMNQMFATWDGVSQLKTINLSSFKTSKVTNMSGMFAGLTELTELDLSNFDTSSVTNMGQMFEGLSKITELDLSNFDTSNVTSMSAMFNKCSSLKALDLSNFNTKKVTTMLNMFLNTTNLQTIYVGPNWSTDGTDIYGMFSNCGTDHVTLKQS